MTQLPEGWKQESELNAVTEHDDGRWGYIHLYPPDSVCAGQYCWQAKQGKAHLSGVVDTQQAAIAKVEEALAMHEALFIRQSGQKIIDDIRDMQQKLAAIGCGDLIDGYAIGYAKGRAEAFGEMRALFDQAQPPEEDA